MSLGNKPVVFTSLFDHTPTLLFVEFSVSDLVVEKTGQCALLSLVFQVSEKNRLTFSPYHTYLELKMINTIQLKCDGSSLLTFKGIKVQTTTQAMTKCGRTNLDFKAVEDCSLGVTKIQYLLQILIYK